MRRGRPLPAWRHLPQLGDLAGPALPALGLSRYPGSSRESQGAGGLPAVTHGPRAMLTTGQVEGCARPPAWGHLKAAGKSAKGLALAEEWPELR